MPKSRFHEIDVTTVDGQGEILGAWSEAVLDLSQAARILKLTQDEVLYLATERGFSPPSPELVAMREAKLDAYFRPLAREGERKRVYEDLHRIISQLDEDVWRMKRIIEWSDAPGLKHSRIYSEKAVALMETASSTIASAAALLSESVILANAVSDAGESSRKGFDE